MGMKSDYIDGQISGVFACRKILVENKNDFEKALSCMISLQKQLESLQKEEFLDQEMIKQGVKK